MINSLSRHQYQFSKISITTILLIDKSNCYAKFSFFIIKRVST